MSREYGNDSIRSLSDKEAVRMRVSTYAGGSDKQGAFTTVREVISNSIDEFKSGHGDTIKVEYLKDGSIRVTDKGRGIPVDWNENEQKYNYELIFMTLNSGGKFEQSNYTWQLGLNGIGNTLVAMSAEYANIEITRDGYKYTLKFEKGDLVGELTKEKLHGEYETGSVIHWLPDLDVFTERDFPDDWFHNYIDQQAIVNKGLCIEFINQNNDVTTYSYENGIVDYIEKVNKKKNITSVIYAETEATGRDREDRPDYNSRYELAFCFNNEINLLESYHNSSYLKNGGSPHNAIKNSFAYAIDKLIKSKNEYKKGEKKISFDDIKDSLVIVSNTYSSETSYENQTKFAITNKFIQDYMTQYLKEQLEIYFIENPMEADKIVQQVLINKRSRESAEKTRLNIKNKLQGKVSFTDKVEGFINCSSKDVTKTECYLAEGRSALGSLKQGRNSEYQAVYALRGKILNCLKADYSKIFKNEIITDLIKILGCGVEVKTKHNKDLSTFDLDGLKWSKIIISCDADQDGNHIATLLLTMFYKLTPTLIKEGKIYIAESPLFEILHKDKSYFAYTDKEKDEIVSNLGGKVVVQRSKGLGENTPEMMWETTMNPETRKLIQVTEEDMNKMEEWFDLLLGDNLIGRKDYIESNLSKYVEEVLD